MSQFVHGFAAALPITRVIAVLVAGLICGYTVGYSHRLVSTPIPAAMVGFLATMWLFGLQIATLIGTPSTREATLLHGLGGHAGYFLLSLVMGVAGWAGAGWAKEARGGKRGSAGRG